MAGFCGINYLDLGTDDSGWFFHLHPIVSGRPYKPTYIFQCEQQLNAAWIPNGGEKNYQLLGGGTMARLKPQEVVAAKRPKNRRWWLAERGDHDLGRDDDRWHPHKIQSNKIRCYTCSRGPIAFSRWDSGAKLHRKLYLELFLLLRASERQQLSIRPLQ